jgi:glutamyl-tRNA reductase
LNTKPARLEDLRIHAWRTASLSPTSLLALEAEIGSLYGWDEGVPIVTCQRYELVTLNSDSPAGAHRSYAGAEALLHLARLAAGLESLVLGETEVLGQVRQALNSAESGLRRVAAPAIAAARILRREAGFDAHAGFALDLALRLAAQPASGDLLVVGGGPMGRRVAERAAELGFVVTLVARRPPPLARGVHYEPFSRLRSLPAADVLVSCLGRRAPLMGDGELPPVRRLAIDLGTPRNLKTDLSAPVVTLAEVMDSGCQTPEETSLRRRLDDRLRDILAAQLSASGPDSPLSVLREEVERIRLRELGRSLRLHPDIPPHKLDAITRSLVNQIFHRPSLRLRRNEDPALAETVAALFRPPGGEDASGD